MTFKDFGKILKGAGFNAAQVRFNKAQPLPYVIYGAAGRSDIHADNIHYFKIPDGYVELYTENKSAALEERLEAALESAAIPWEWDYEQYIESEHMMVVRWNIQMIGG